MIVVFRIGVLLVLLSVSVQAQKFTRYNDSSFCQNDGFSMVLRSEDGPRFFAFGQYAVMPPIQAFVRTPSAISCDSIQGPGAISPSDRSSFAQYILHKDTLTIATPDGTFRSADWGPWQPVALAMPNREIVITSLAPLPDGRLLAAAHSYVVVRRDTSGGVIASYIDSSRYHVGFVNGLAFDETSSFVSTSLSVLNNTGATLPDGTTYFGSYLYKNAQSYLLEVSPNGSTSPVATPAGMAHRYQSPVVVRVGDHIVYTFYGRTSAERETSPACYVRLDTRTRESSLHYVDGPFPNGGWSGDSVALVMAGGSVWVVQENSVKLYNVEDQISGLPWTPSFYSAHRTSSNEWLLSSNSGVYFFTFDVTTSVDDDVVHVNAQRIATSARTLDLSDRDPDPASMRWEVIDAVGNTCATGVGPNVTLPPASGMYVVRFRNTNVAVLAY
jgi:hypothetical protein